MPSDEISRKFEGRESVTKCHRLKLESACVDGPDVVLSSLAIADSLLCERLVAESRRSQGSSPSRREVVQDSLPIKYLKPPK